MTADCHPPYRALREAVGARETSRAREAGVSVAGADCGRPRWPREVAPRIGIRGREVRRRDRSRVRRG